jgi:ribosomal protein L34E
MHWDRVDDRGMRFDDLLASIRNFPENQVWRYAVAGDLPGIEENISPFMLARLVKANEGRRGFTYTHKSPHNPVNARAIQSANRKGFTINLSSNNVEQADEYLRLGIAPVVTLIPDDFGGDEVTITKAQGNKTVEKTVRVWRNTRTPGGALVVQCPAEYNENVQCANCGGSQGPLCRRADRNFVVGFTTHGFSKKKASNIARRGLPIVEV